MDAQAIQELLVKLGPQLKEIFERFSVRAEAREEILGAAVQEVTYREREKEDMERRLLRAVERRCAAWREDGAESQGDPAETPNGQDNEQAR